MTDTLECATHGKQEATYICTHIVESLHDRNPHGFFWTDEDGFAGWCLECEEKRLELGWVKELYEFMDFKPLCRSCFEMARGINSVGSEAFHGRS